MMTNIQNDYLAFLGNYLQSKLDTKAIDCNVSLHKDYYYTPTVNCDISVLFITGAIQQKITQHPIQILIEVEDEFKDDILDCLYDLSYNLNETKTTLGGDTYRVFFNSPCVTQKFVETGVKRRATLTMEASIIKFSSVMDCDIKISVDDIHYEEIKYTSLAVSYVADLSSSGSLGSTKVKQTPQSCMTTYQISFVPHNDTYLEDKINDIVNTNEQANEYFGLKIYMHTKNENTYHFSCVLQSASYTKDFNGFPTLTISLMRRS